MTRRLAIIAASLPVVLAPATAHANVGVPMIFPSLFGMVICLIPIILLEALILRWRMRIGFKRGVKASALANLATTVIGIPVTWFVWLFVGLGLRYLGLELGINTSINTSVGKLVHVAVFSAWLYPFEAHIGWMAPAAAAFLLIPYFFASWLVEYLVVRRLEKGVDRPIVSKSVFWANIASYSVLALVLLGLFLPAWADRPKDDYWQTGLNWSTDEEIRSLKIELDRIREKNQAKKCLRPVLRGKPLQGSASDEMRTLIYPDKELKECERLLSEKSDIIYDLLVYPEGETRPAWPPRSNRTARPIDESKNGQEIEKIVRVCQPFLERMQRVVSHEDVCNPFMPGLNPDPTMVPAYITSMRSANVVSMTARKHMDKGEFKEALELLIDTMRFGQDLGRGGTDMVAHFIGVATTRAVLPEFEYLLNRKEKLGRDLLLQVEKELSALFESEPQPLSMIEGCIESDLFVYSLPLEKGIEWSPEDSWDKFTGVNISSTGVSPWHYCRAMVMAAAEMKSAIPKLCPDFTLASTCYEGISNYYIERTFGRSDVSYSEADAHIEMLLKLGVFSWRKIVDIKQAAWAASYKLCVVHQGHRLFYIAALRLIARYRLMSEESGSCPDISAFDKEPLLSLRTDPYSGKQILVEKHGDDLLVLRSPAPMGKQAGQDKEPALVIECPYR